MKRKLINAALAAATLACYALIIPEPFGEGTLAQDITNCTVTLIGIPALVVAAILNNKKILHK